MDDGNVICKSCEREVDDSLTWCPFCGATLAGSPPASASERFGAELDGGMPDEPIETPGFGAVPAGDPAESGDPFASTSRGPLPSEPIPRVTGATPEGPNRATLVTLGLVVAALIGGGIAVFAFLRGGSGDVEAAELKPGDCWNDVDLNQTEVFEVPGVPCSEPHDNEVFAVVEVPGSPGSPYPGMDTLDLLGGDMCLEEFERYTGERYEISPLDIWMLFPTPSSWQVGDREVICSLFRMDLQKMTGSQRAP